MLAAQRRIEIVARLRAQEQVSTREAADALGVSEATARRDLTALMARGLATRVHGGARRLARPGPAASRCAATVEQDAIAAAAAGTVPPGTSIGLSGGATIHALAEHLVTVPGLTVVTNSLRAADILGRQAPPDERSTVILIGGYRTGVDLLGGPLTAAALSTIRLEMSFFDCAGIDARSGATTADITDAEARRALAKVSARSIVLAEPRQHGARALSTFLAFDHVDMVITAAPHSRPDDEQWAILRNAKGYIVADTESVASAWTANEGSALTDLTDHSGHSADV